MENYENKELLKEAAKQSLAKLKDLEPGTEDYEKTAKAALQLYEMQIKSEAQESDQNLKEDEERRKGQEVINDQEKAAKARHLEWAKFGLSCVTFLGTIGTTNYWSILEAGGVAPLSSAMKDGLHEIKRGFTDRKFRRNREGSWRKLWALFIFYEISRHTAKRVDELLRERLPVQSSGVPCLHALPGTGKRLVRDPAALQRENQGHLLERH